MDSNDVAKLIEDLQKQPKIKDLVLSILREDSPNCNKIAERILIDIECRVAVYYNGIWSGMVDDGQKPKEVLRQSILTLKFYSKRSKGKELEECNGYLPVLIHLEKMLGTDKLSNDELNAVY